ncbi:MAG: hypothetical protein ACK4YP_08710 [Myxococcota bacterium]
MWRHSVRDPRLRRAVVDAFVPVIYLGALVVPPIGSTLLWFLGDTWTREPTLRAHLERALRVQLVGATLVALLQAGVLAIVLLARPTLLAHDALRHALFLADLTATAGLWLATALLGPVLLLGYGAGPRPVLRYARRARPLEPRRAVLVEDFDVPLPRAVPAAPTFRWSAGPRIATAPADVTRQVAQPG